MVEIAPTAIPVPIGCLFFSNKSFCEDTEVVLEADTQQRGFSFFLHAVYRIYLFSVRLFLFGNIT